MIVDAIIEIPKNSTYKYEVDKITGELILDRVLPDYTPIPQNYGFIPSSLCEDGDALDVFLVAHNSIPPLTKVKVEIVGALKCLDNGEQDDKLLGILVGERTLMTSLDLMEIKHYLTNYKTGFIIQEQLNQEQAIKVLEESRKAFQDAR